MDFSEKFESIKDFLGQKFSSLKEFVEENKKLAILILALVLVILLCIILIFAAAGSKKTVVLDDPLVLASDLQVPPNPANPDAFQLSRTTKDKWELSEIEPYFTKPSEKEIEDLSKANDKLIRDILEAAP